MLKERESMERGGSSPCSSLGGSSGFEVASCAGCGGRIQDRYYLLAVDRQWHAHCLKCCECKLPLDTELTCFARDGNIYCKDDYYRYDSKYFFWKLNLIDSFSEYFIFTDEISEWDFRTGIFNLLFRPINIKFQKHDREF